MKSPRVEPLCSMVGIATPIYKEHDLTYSIYPCLKRRGTLLSKTRQMLLGNVKVGIFFALNYVTIYITDVHPIEIG